MYAPRASEKVQVTSKGEVFWVVWVHLERQEADLIPFGESETGVESVPFSKLEPVSMTYGAPQV